MAGFYEVILNKARGTVFDLGTGSGILTEFASPHADTIYAVEINKSVAKITKTKLKHLKNVFVLCGDASKITFSKKADIIICEMLDTALIDEEQIPVLNHARKFLKTSGEIIPCGIINCVEPVQVGTETICYEENGSPQNEVLGIPIFYSKINFTDKTDENFEKTIDIKINKEGIVSGIKITTFTLLSKNIICGPTPMLNSPLIIPLKKLKVGKGDELKLDLSYKMGGGLESVRAGIKKVHR